MAFLNRIRPSHRPIPTLASNIDFEPQPPPRLWRLGEVKELACGFAPGHKVGDENQITRKPTRSSFTLLRQLLQSDSRRLLPKLVRDAGAAEISRTFTPWNHVVSLIFAQLTHALGLNGVADACVCTPDRSRPFARHRPQQERIFHHQPRAPHPVGPGSFLGRAGAPATSPSRLRHSPPAPVRLPLLRVAQPVGAQLRAPLCVVALGAVAKLEPRSLLEIYGTAGGGGRFPGTPQQAFLARSG